jgi:hypothetical protein
VFDGSVVQVYKLNGLLIWPKRGSTPEVHMAIHTAIEESEYPAATRHDPSEEIFPDVFLVRGSLQMNMFMAFNRNMLIVRQGSDLTVINSVRLTEAGERQLDALGTVKHVVRLGCFHGRDDRYYVDRYKAQFWAPAELRPGHGPAPEHLLEEAGPLPIEGAQLMLFAHSRRPEGLLLLQRDGGILLTCDCLQYYTDRRFCSLAARIMMPLMGFPLKMLIGPLWKKAQTPEGESLRADFERIVELDFEHLISAHGSLKRGDAKQAVQQAIVDSYAQ